MPNRFFGTRDFLYLKLGIRDLIRASLGIESMLRRWDAKNNPRDYRIALWVEITGLKNAIGDPRNLNYARDT